MNIKKINKDQVDLFYKEANKYRQNVSKIKKAEYNREPFPNDLLFVDPIVQEFQDYSLQDVNEWMVDVKEKLRYYKACERIFNSLDFLKKNNIEFFALDDRADRYGWNGVTEDIAYALENFIKELKE